MSEALQIERAKLGVAAMSPRMARDYEFFVRVSTAILEAEGFVFFDETTGYYDVFDGKKFTQTLWGNPPYITEQVMPPYNTDGRLRYSRVQRFTRDGERFGVIAEARFKNLEDYTRRTDFHPFFRSLVGALGVRTIRIIPSADLERVQLGGCHPFEAALELECIVKKPTKYGDLYILGLPAIQALAGMVSERGI